MIAEASAAEPWIGSREFMKSMKRQRKPVAGPEPSAVPSRARTRRRIALSPLSSGGLAGLHESQAGHGESRVSRNRLSEIMGRDNHPVGLARVRELILEKGLGPSVLLQGESGSPDQVGELFSFLFHLGGRQYKLVCNRGSRNSSVELRLRGPRDAKNAFKGSPSLPIRSVSDRLMRSINSHLPFLSLKRFRSGEEGRVFVHRDRFQTERRTWSEIFSNSRYGTSWKIEEVQERRPASGEPYLRVRLNSKGMTYTLLIENGTKIDLPGKQREATLNMGLTSTGCLIDCDWITNVGKDTINRSAFIRELSQRLEQFQISNARLVF